MVKKGEYAVYKGKEYEAIINSDEKLGISLLYVNTGEFFKKVEIDKLEYLYSINPVCIYKGYIYGIFAIKDNKIFIVGDEHGFEKELEFEAFDRGAYGKWLNIDDVECLWHFKTSMRGFPTPPNQIEVIRGNINRIMEVASSCK